ncbi:hypothetical protein O7632_04725 [Solwaraspora sp. WMMD406]|uniref:hypothetical protein n=1 Tax=Solwaraspora sp. WMMD406 TaxID=3016095 RepID=UPI0024174060|nr:hypothetical protein [Solwaraspora sp. WMMD406]MDG4763414.1 hypothetical protein [Solwaraspora sp. WMMD406]
MTAPERILQIPRVGVEHEYRWVMPATSLADAASRDELRHRLIQFSGLRLADQTTILQHTLCLDDAQWSLSAANCSLTALVNRGQGPSWLVAKETIQWVDGRRDVLEMTEYVADMRTLSSADVLAGRPGQHLSRRVHTLSDIRVFGYLAQRRTKAALLTDQLTTLALSCDAVELRDATSKLVNTFAVVEVEVNQASRIDLDVLDGVADKFSAHFGRPPAQTTKPQLAAASLGWSGSRDN